MKSLRFDALMSAAVFFNEYPVRNLALIGIEQYIQYGQTVMTKTINNTLGFFYRNVAVSIACLDVLSSSFSLSKKGPLEGFYSFCKTPSTESL